MDPDLEARIRERAYALWVQDGRAHGKADDYWYVAEREIRGEDAEAAPADPSVFTIPDSEMLTGEPDPGEAPGGPTVAALGAAPAVPGKARRMPAGTRPARGRSAAAPAEASAAEAAPGRQSAEGVAPRGGATKKNPKTK
jgi:hypothetical protein